MPDTSIVVILVRPQMGENIGAAARAMMNFGITDLRLVAPRDGWPNQAAIDMSAGAFEHMPEPHIFKTLPESLHDCHFSYATTARARDMNKQSYIAQDAASDALKRHNEGQKVAFIFGPERTGLENEDLSYCNALVHIPTHPDFSSINLGQSVLLMCYQLLIEKSPQNMAQSDKKHEPAPQNELQNLFSRLEEQLDDTSFFKNDDLRSSALKNIRNLFLRAEPSEQEVKTFHGIIRALTTKSKT